MSVFRRICYCCLLSCLLSACSSGYISESGDVWNTHYNIVYSSEKNLTDSFKLVFEKVDRSVSVFNDSSIVSRINRNDTMVIVDSVFIGVFELSKLVNTMSKGVFDPTVEPLVEYYGFGRNRDFNGVDTAQINILKAFVGIDECRIIEGKVHKKSPQTTFNFSAIAKGYTVDLIAEMFRRNGVENFMIEIGGDIAVSGSNSDGEPWAVMLEPTQLLIRLSEGGVATSGNYRNNHGKIGHIIDPRTGLPTSINARSISVVAPTCALADAVATAYLISEFSLPDSIKVFYDR